MSPKRNRKEEETFSEKALPGGIKPQDTLFIAIHFIRIFYSEVK